MRFFLKKKNGSITVFLVLILVPSIFFVGFLDDLARMKFYNNQAVMAADNYSQAILSEYDNLLKDLYGFFAVTQNDEAKAALDSLQEYMGTSFDPSSASINYDYDSLNLILGEKSYEGFMPYSNANFSFSYELMPGSTLDNNDVFATQLGDFMRFRIIQQFIDSDGNFVDNLSGLVDAVVETSANDEVAAAKADCEKPIEEFVTAVQEYYEALAVVTEYSSYITSCNDILDKSSGSTKTIGERIHELEDSQDYFDYKLLEGYEEIYVNDNYSIDKSAIEAIDSDVQAEKQRVYDEEGISLSNEQTDTFLTLTNDNEIRLIKKYWDKQSLVSSLEYEFKLIIYDYQSTTKLNSLGTGFEDNYSIDNPNSISMATFDTALDKLTEKANNVNEKLDAVNEKIEIWENALNSGDVSKEVIETDEKYIEKIKETIDMVDYFDDIPNDIEMHGDREVNDTFSSIVISNYKILNDAYDDFFKCEEMDISGLELFFVSNIEDKTVSVVNGESTATVISESIIGSGDYYDYRKWDEYNQIWANLKFNFGNDGDDNLKKEADKKKQAAKDEQKKGEEELNKDQDTDARDIPSSLGFTSEGNISYAFKDIGKLLGNITGGNWANEGNRRLLQIYAIEYDFGMFSSRVTNVNPDSNSSSGSISSNSAPALSMTGYEMAKNINYLYGAELEYLIGGSNSSKTNLNTTRDAIVAFRMLMNFTSTYTIKEVNDAIQAIAKPFNGIPYVGPAVAIAVDIALRIAVATAETVCDWKALIKGEKVVLYKNKVEDLQCIKGAESAIGSLLDGKVSSSSGSTSSDSEKKIELGYEDYLLIMMIFFVPPDALFDRTQNLVELNVNTVAQGIGSDGTLSSLTFKMSEAYTAVTTTCTIDSGFVFMPDGFAQMLLGADSDTYTALKKFEENKYGYSVIRGY